MASEKQKNAVAFCERTLGVKYAGDLTDRKAVSAFLDRHLNNAKKHPNAPFDANCERRRLEHIEYSGQPILIKNGVAKSKKAKKTNAKNTKTQKSVEIKPVTPAPITNALFASPSATPIKPTNNLDPLRVRFAEHILGRLLASSGEGFDDDEVVNHAVWLADGLIRALKEIPPE